MFDWFKKKRQPIHGPNFSAIDSREKAEAMFHRGELERLLLLPPEFGGEDNDLNAIFVPLGLADIKGGIDANIIGPLVEAGQVTHYSANPEYQGKSFIPIAIKIIASDPGDFTTTINIWGDALGRE